MKGISLVETRVQILLFIKRRKVGLIKLMLGLRDSRLVLVVSPGVVCVGFVT